MHLPQPQRPVAEAVQERRNIERGETSRSIQEQRGKVHISSKIERENNDREREQER